MTNNVTIVDNCTGCMACELRCNHSAITYIKNHEGFLFPNVEEGKCKQCGACLRVCPQIKDVSGNKIRKIYAVRNINQEVLMRSSSGGAFSGIAEYVLIGGGVVYGCEVTTDFKIRHIGVKCKEELKRLNGSKYVQSDIDGTYKEAIENLEEGLLVVFCGTPCQIAGFKSVLKHEYDNLILVDLICHGVPSEGLFQLYIRWLEERHKFKINSYMFRYKGGNSWGLPYRSLIQGVHNKKYIAEASFDPYLNAFVNGWTFRECCYSCKYGNEYRMGDFTIGDFWNLDKNNKIRNDGKGISFFSLNTDKAIHLWEEIKKTFVVYEEIESPSEDDFIRLRKKKSTEPEIRKSIYTNLDHPNKLFNHILKCRPTIKNYLARYLPTCLTHALKYYMER